MYYFYGAMIIGVIGFQIALILGAPWGRLTQGGQTQGPLPLAGRLMAAVSIGILIGLVLAIASADGRAPHWPAWTGWLALAMHGVMTVLNWITPSVPERKLWGPLTTLMLAVAAVIVLT